MENNEFQKKMEAILEKRRNCVPLTDAEEKIVSECLNKLLDSKKCVRKTVEIRVGKEIKKGDVKLPTSTSEPKRDFKGAFDSKAKIEESEDIEVNDANTTEPTRKDPKATGDKKEEKLPKEDTAGEPRGDQNDPEWADADEKEFSQEQYEEDRVGRYTERANYPDSIKTKDIVIKSLSNGTKLVGQVLKIYRRGEQTGLLVKWASGQFEHVNLKEVDVLKSKSEKTQSEEDKKSSPPIVEAQKVVKADETPNATSLPSEPPAEWIKSVVEVLKELTDLSEQEIVDMAKAAWGDIVGGQPEKVMETEDIKKPEDTTKSSYPMPSSEIKKPDVTTTAAVPTGTSEVRSVKPRIEYEMPSSEIKTPKKSEAAVDVEKNGTEGGAPPSDWLEECKAALVRDKVEVDNPFAICTASWQRKQKGLAVGDIVKISADEMKEICLSCAEKMVAKRIRFYKFTISTLEK